MADSGSPSPGATGFVGTALVERLLRSVPGCELVLLVRAGKRRPAAERVRREIFKNDAFDRLRARAAAADGRAVRRDGRPAGHDDHRRRQHRRSRPRRRRPGASRRRATSSSTPPPRWRSTRRSTRAVEINLLGPTRIARRCSVDSASRRTSSPCRTCYVAGNRRGSAPEELVSEGPFDIGLDWRKEVAAARRLRSDLEAASRHPTLLGSSAARPARELGAAGAPALAAKTEQLRERWVTDQLVEAGRARAAQRRLARRVRVHQGARRAGADRRPRATCRCASSARRSSSRRSPSRSPGWIRGFRMAEPVIISYARGPAQEFPGVPEGTVDVIPVDLVVAAIIAVAAIGPRSPADHPGGQRRHQPAAVQAARRQRPRLVHASTRCTTPRASRSSCPSGRSPAGAGCRSS